MAQNDWSCLYDIYETLSKVAQNNANWKKGKLCSANLLEGLDIFICIYWTNLLPERGSSKYRKFLHDILFKVISVLEKFSFDDDACW